MKIERINENQIRCTLTSSDLSARNLNLGELAYGTEKAKKLFHEMIQKASNEVGFEADDIPLMVEAIPLSSESIMLIITKMVDEFIAYTETKTMGTKTTVVRCVLRNGFEIVESTGCVDEKNYSEKIGYEICMERIKNKIWELLGFLLQMAWNGIQ